MFKGIYGILSFFLLTLSLVGGVVLVKQTQDMRDKAAESDNCKLWSAQPYPAGWKEIRNFTLNSPEGSPKKIAYKYIAPDNWQIVYRCDYQKLMEKKGNVNECLDSDAEDTWNNTPHTLEQKTSKSIRADADYGYTPDLYEMIDTGHYGGKCQVIQVDVTGCPGGVAYIVYANDECPTEPTPTPTHTPVPTVPGQPTHTPTPTPTPTDTPVPTPTPTNVPGQPTNTPAPTNTPVHVAEIQPSPTRITLPDAGVDFPVKALTIVGSIVTLLGFLILL